MREGGGRQHSGFTQIVLVIFFFDFESTQPGRKLQQERKQVEV